MSVFVSRSDLTSWGRVSRPRQFVASPRTEIELNDLLIGGERFDRGLLPRGLGRSYGDSNLNAEGGVIDCRDLSGILAFDAKTGLLTAAGGASLERIIAFALPRGFFLPVAPGTKFVTLGGAIANDVHGKNHHHAGTIGRWIEEIGLLRSDGTRHRLTPGDETGLFAATIGGLGLTGIVTHAVVRLRQVTSARMEAETIPFANLAEFFAMSTASAATHDYCVAWVDCLARGRSLGRGLFTRANHAKDGPLAVSARKGPAVPVEMPGVLLNRWSIGGMNAAYYALGKSRAGAKRVPYDSYFFPLDGIRHWNRCYGATGMYQYQSVVPPDVGAAATEEMLRQIATAGEGSFLAVLKTFGALPSPGFLSFPMEGATLALDFPNKGTSTLKLLERLDDVVREAKGRLYPAKDGRMAASMFRQGYPALDRFRARLDPGLSSSFWRRMTEN